MTALSLFERFTTAVDSERLHLWAINALRLLPTIGQATLPPVLASCVAGIHLPSPIGLAAGFDKDAKVPRKMLAMGFGFAEVGSITPLPQPGNPRPRLFRLAEDRAVINRMGFNNGGLDAAHARLAKVRGCGVIGVNVGANKDSADRIADYAIGVRKMADVASYIAINISSPNTPGLRALQDGAALAELLDAVAHALPPGGPPVFLKVAPDLESAEIDVIARIAIGKVAALIVANTTLSRPPLSSRHAGEAGGLSGAPLHDLALQSLRDFRTATGGALPLIGVGGIATADQAYARIRAGASLIQLYSAMVYDGPGIAWRMARGLAVLLERDGFASVADAVGVDAR